LGRSLAGRRHGDTGPLGLNQRPDSLGRATFFLLLAPSDTAGIATKTVGIRGDSLRALSGRYFSSPPALHQSDKVGPQNGSSKVWMFGRTLYSDHPGGFDATYDAFELATVDSLQLRGRFFRSWGIGVPLGVSG